MLAPIGRDYERRPGSPAVDRSSTELPAGSVPKAENRSAVPGRPFAEAVFVAI
jgi:hypothetical protein